VNGLILILGAFLVVWMGACVYYGYKARIVAFLAVLCTGLAINLTWMMVGLNARLTEPNLLIALASAAVYGVCAFGFGMLVGRLVRAWRASAVDSPEV
jgi:putative Mn2+ efflux pump MntP